VTTSIQLQPEPYCPVCGAQMHLIRPKRGQDWPPFWGCTEYKFGCRGKRNIGPDGRPENDEGEFTSFDFD